MSKTRFKIPHTLVLLFSIIVLAQLLTYLLPQGEFERRQVEGGATVVVDGSYHLVDDPRWLAPTAFLTALPKGLSEAHEIIVFLFIVGGAFAVLRATGTVDALIGFLLARFSRRPGLLIAGGVVVFAAGSSSIGMAEEYIPFVPVLIALCLALGYDRITAIGILCAGYAVGYGCAIANPFTVLIAQSFAELPPVSGIGYRLILNLVFLTLAIHHVWRYAERIRRDPSQSLMASIENPDDAEVHSRQHPHPTALHWTILGLVVAVLALMTYGIAMWHWYLIEMGALFAGLTIGIAALGRLAPDRAARDFCVGASELTTTALMIGFARAIQVVLSEGRVIDTIVHSISLPLTHLGPSAAAIGMFYFQSFCNLFIPSGSGQVYVTMPLMVPLSDLLNINRQIAVLAYQFGDGFTNILVPTSPVLVAFLSMAKVPLDRWYRFVVPFMIKIAVVGSLAMAVAVWFGYE